MSKEKSAEQSRFFREAVSRRLRAPIVKQLFENFEREGLYEVSWEIINTIPKFERKLLLHTLSAHVTKEKPVFIHAIGKHSSKGEENSKFVAASTDLIWALSLMLDDVIDNDNYRAGEKAAWVVYGSSQVKGGVWKMVELIAKQQADRISPETPQLLRDCIDDGMKSILDPAIHSLELPVVAIIQNVDRRARFHCEYPMRAIFQGDSTHQERGTVGIRALYASNLAGQILNDVKDLVRSDIYGRPIFSDIVAGTTTIPLRIMFESMGNTNRKFLMEIFGRKDLDVKTAKELEKIVLADIPRSQIHQLIFDTYKQFIDKMRLIIEADDLEVCNEWVKYKMAQADRLLLQQ